MQRGKADSDSLEQADLRLRRTMQMQSEASEQLKFSQVQHDNAVRLLQALRSSHAQLKKSFLFNKVNHFQSSSARLAALATAAKESKSSPSAERKTASKTAACSQSKHLFQIFSRKEEEEEREVEQLEQRLGGIYEAIGKCIEEELLSEKVMVRIKKESRRAAKVKSIQQLQREIGKYKGWLQESKARLSNDFSEKEVEQKVLHNLESMKLLMNKKIISNDYIFDQFGEEAKEIHRLVDGLDSFKAAMRSKALQYNKAVQECLTHTQLSRSIQPIKRTPAKPPAPFSSTDIIKCFQQGQELMQEIESYDSSLPLRCSALQAAVEEWQKGNRR